ncbi:hypothetical protein [Nocardia farcinica]|uniref:DUF8020 domain-containing protein n=1 Tax=Nocardia farcinica TaxID=37329 RepID=A0A449G620_NOCFR|nr:hypothetical protein [Nocardia farcinica]MBF6359847.1 hypothetical protein [Nocardia farcinica]VFA91234.1 Uncharacterised protein [Nocardia farcinica]VFA96122.1 Uncharacterised protein [Nocardia farcinica]
MRKFTVTGTAAAMLAAGIVTANVSTADSPRSIGVNFTAATTETSTVITTDAGTMTAEDGVFKIKAADGTVLAGAQLSFRVDDFVFPIDADITDRTATLTPVLDVEHAEYRPAALPYQDQAPWKTAYEREQAAWQRLTTTISMGAALGAVVGSIGGAAIGCVLGGIAGATVAAAAIVGLFGAFVPAATVGCIGGIVTMGPLGALAGQLLITAPVAILAAVQYFTTINEPMPNQPTK